MNANERIIIGLLHATGVPVPPEVDAQLARFEGARRWLQAGPPGPAMAEVLVDEALGGQGWGAKQLTAAAVASTLAGALEGADQRLDVRAAAWLGGLRAGLHDPIEQAVRERFATLAGLHEPLAGVDLTNPADLVSRGAAAVQAWTQLQTVERQVEGLINTCWSGLVHPGQPARFSWPVLVDTDWVTDLDAMFDPAGRLVKLTWWELSKRAWPISLAADDGEYRSRQQAALTRRDTVLARAEQEARRRSVAQS